MGIYEVKQDLYRRVTDGLRKQGYEQSIIAGMCIYIAGDDVENF